MYLKEIKTDKGLLRQKSGLKITAYNMHLTLKNKMRYQFLY